MANEKDSSNAGDGKGTQGGTALDAKCKLADFLELEEGDTESEKRDFLELIAGLKDKKTRALLKTITSTMASGDEEGKQAVRAFIEKVEWRRNKMGRS